MMGLEHFTGDLKFRALSSPRDLTKKYASANTGLFKNFTQKIKRFLQIFSLILHGITFLHNILLNKLSNELKVSRKLFFKMFGK
jgi:hypothetical protein